MNHPPFPRPTEPERFEIRRPDPERLAELSQTIADGRYEVAATDVADAIIEFYRRGSEDPRQGA